MSRGTINEISQNENEGVSQCLIFSLKSVKFYLMNGLMDESLNETMSESAN